MEEELKNKRIGLIGTSLFHVGIIVLLCIFAFRTPLPLPEEEGVFVSLGNSKQNAGNNLRVKSNAPQNKDVTEAISPSSKTQNKANPAKETHLTQDIEDAPTLQATEESAKKKEEDARNAAEKRKIQEEIERKRKEAEQQKAKIDAIQDRAKNAFGNAKTTESPQEETSGGFKSDSNNTEEEGMNHRESVSAGNNKISYSLQGRNSLSIPKPQYRLQEEGKVVVEITVDKNGKVVNARPGMQGSTTSNSTLFEAAKKAALKAKFNADNDAPAYQKGLITYHFQLE